MHLLVGWLGGRCEYKRCNHGQLAYLSHARFILFFLCLFLSSFKRKDLLGWSLVFFFSEIIVYPTALSLP